MNSDEKLNNLFLTQINNGDIINMVRKVLILQFSFGLVILRMWFAIFRHFEFMRISWNKFA